MHRGRTRAFPEPGAARYVLVGLERTAGSRCGQDASVSNTRGLPVIIRLRHRRGESVLDGRQRRPAQGRRAAIARTLVAAGHVRAAAGTARDPRCPEIPRARHARRMGDRANRSRTGDHGVGVNRAFKPGSRSSTFQKEPSRFTCIISSRSSRSVTARRLPISAVCVRSPCDRGTGSEPMARLCAGLFAEPGRGLGLWLADEAVGARPVDLLDFESFRHRIWTLLIQMRGQ